MKIASGTWVIGIGVLHEVFGLLAGAGVITRPGEAPQNLLGAIGRDGIVNAVEADITRVAFFWFFFFGLLLLMLGGLMQAIEKKGQALPRSIGWQLGALGLGGGLLIPASGFWLVLPVAWSVVRGAGRPECAS
jgi:Family of unknown function (DUF6463)